METIGQNLDELRARSGLNKTALAHKMGYKGVSGIQRYLEDSYDGMPHLEWWTGLANALEGLGKPPITRDEVLLLGSNTTRHSVPAVDIMSLMGVFDEKNTTKAGDDIMHDELYDLAVEALSRLTPTLRKRAYFAVISQSNEQDAASQSDSNP